MERKSEIYLRRKKLFRGARFSSAIMYNGDPVKGIDTSFAYFSGCGVDGSYLILTKNRGTLFTHEMNLRAAKKVSKYPVELLGKEAAKQLKKACGRGKTAFSGTDVSTARYFALKKKAKLKLTDASEKMQQVRGEKSQSEIKALHESAVIARKILEKLDPWKYRTENELAQALKIIALKAGAEISFEPIVATGKNSALPHHQATQKKLEDFVLVDFGVKHDGYCSDFTRCYFRRKNMKEKIAYDKCAAIFEEIAKKLPECKAGKDIAKLSDELMKKYQMPKMIHAIGHGIGMDVHEYPHLNGKSKDSLKNVVIAIEPAAYFQKFGVRFEEMMANTRNGWKKA